MRQFIYHRTKLGNEIVEEIIKSEEELFMDFSFESKFCKSVVPEFADRQMILHPSLKASRVSQEERVKMIN